MQSELLSRLLGENGLTGVNGSLGINYLKTNQSIQILWKIILNKEMADLASLPSR